MACNQRANQCTLVFLLLLAAHSQEVTRKYTINQLAAAYSFNIHKYDSGELTIESSVIEAPELC